MSKVTKAQTNFRHSREMLSPQKRYYGFSRHEDSKDHILDKKVTS